MRAVFGLSFGEFVVIAIVALVVVGPKNLPTLLRSVAQWLARVRRMASDIRAESGIDEALELESLRAEIHRLRNLTSVESLIEEPETAAKPRPQLGAIPAPEKEYPPIGVDSYGAISEDDAALLEVEEADAAALHNAPPAGMPTTVPALSPSAMRQAKAE